MMSTDTQAQKDDREVVSTIYYRVTKPGREVGKGVLTRINLYFSFPEFVEV